MAPDPGLTGVRQRTGARPPSSEAQAPHAVAHRLGAGLARPLAAAGPERQPARVTNAVARPVARPVGHRLVVCVSYDSPRRR